jgi:mRNA interferase MazF
MRWGDVRWYPFRTPNKRRPVLVLTRNLVVNSLDRVVVAGITSVVRNIHSEVLLDEADGMPGKCVVSLDNISTVERHVIEGPDSLITTLDEEAMHSVRLALLFSLGFEE